MELSIRDSSTLAAHGPRLALAQGRSSKPDVSSPGGPAASFKGGALAASCGALQTLTRSRPLRRPGRRAPRGVLRRAQGSALLPEPELPRPSETAVVWFRSGDLRVEDHPGLARAAGAPSGTVCCYVFEARELARLSERRLNLLRAAVENLRQQLKSRYGLPLHVCAASSGPEKVYELCKDVKASDVYIHEDPVDLHVDSLQELRALGGEKGELRVHTWRAPLRSSAGSLSAVCRSYDEYVSAREEMPTEPLKAPTELEARFIVAVPSWSLEGLPDAESSREVLQHSGEVLQKQMALRQSVSYVLGLGSSTASEAEALRLLSLFTSQGAEALAEDAFGTARDREEVPQSKEEWAFRRVAGGPDGYRGLIPGEVFSRVLSEMMLWLGCVSMRTAAAALRQGTAEEDCRAALEALEANEWHRLLALADLSDGKLFEHSDVKFFRWRGYLCRYIAPSRPPAADSPPPVLAIHGFAASCTQFAPLATALAEADADRPIPLYALDMLGFGHAEKPPVSITQYVWEQCVKDFLLSVVATPAVVMGNSIGGYMAQSAAAFLGPSVCRGLILLNSAGPLLSMEDYQTLLRSSGGTVLERMREGYGSDANLPEYAPPPQWLVDFGAWILLRGLQPNIAGILKSLYPSNTEPTAELATEIFRDSQDPFASNVIGCFSRLGPNRPANELLEEYAAQGEGRLLVCQGMSDRLGGGPGNQPSRLAGFLSAVPALKARGEPLQDCGHCPHHENPADVASALRRWMQEVVLDTVPS